MSYKSNHRLGPSGKLQSYLRHTSGPQKFTLRFSVPQVGIKRTSTKFIGLNTSKACSPLTEMSLAFSTGMIALGTMYRPSKLLNLEEITNFANHFAQ